MKAILLVLCLLLAGCQSAPLSELPLGQARSVFRPAKKYAIVINGQVFVRPKTQKSISITTTEDVQTKCELLNDPWVAGDMDRIQRLLAHKEYDIYRFDFTSAKMDDLDDLLAKISKNSDTETRLFIAYSGKGSFHGLSACGLKIENSMILPVKGIIKPAELFQKLQNYPGQVAMLLNACEAGVFVKNAPTTLRGVIFAACDIGKATTAYEPYGTTAIYATFLDLYREDPSKVYNLADLKIETVGGWFNNLQYHLFSSSEGNLEVSFTPIFYRNGRFDF